jgi:hypothetical protein
VNTREAARGVAKLIIIDRHGRLLLAADEVRPLIGRPEAAVGCSPTPHPGASGPEVQHCPDGGPPRDEVCVAAERVLWAGPGLAEAWR